MPIVQPTDYQLGDLATFSAQSPDSGLLMLTAPDETTIQITAPGMTTYRLEQAGAWHWRWEDDDQGEVTVHPQEDEPEPTMMGVEPMMLTATPDLPRGMSLDDLKVYIDKTGTEADDLLGSILASAVQSAQNYTGRQLLPLPKLDSATTTLTSREDLRLPVPVRDARLLSAVKVNGATTTGYKSTLSDSGTLIFLDLSAVTLTDPPRADVAMTGRFGFDPMPPDLMDAIYTHASSQWYRRAGVYSDSAQLTESGGIASYFWTMPNEVRAVYESYILGPEIG